MTSNKRGKEGDMNKKEVIAERQLAHILIEIYPYDERSNALSHDIYRIMEWHKEELKKVKDEAYNLGYERGCKASILIIDD